MDAGPPVEMDAGPAPDGGAPDAGEPPCACPTYPTTCSAPTADVPAFTPDADDVGAQLFNLIACATTSVDMAIYEGDWECLSGAITDAMMRNPSLDVTIIVDDDRCAAGDCFTDDVPAGVTVVRDTRSGLMHHKFAIADGSRLWVASANFSRRSFCSDFNNAIVLDEAPIVARYQSVFDRMEGGGFGPVAPEMPVTSGIYTAYFSPESPISSPAAWQDAMVAEIDMASTSIEVMVFAWTRTEISTALVNAAMRGVTVRALVSPLYSDDAPAMALIAAGIDVREAPVHSKVMILDAQTVVTGSANWSMNAWSNNENSLWIRDTTVAGVYRSEFETRYAVSSPPTP